MGKNIIDFIIHFGIKGLSAVVAGVKGLYAQFKNLVSIIKSSAKWVERLKKLLSSGLTIFGGLASIISQVITLWQMFKKSASEAAESAKEAAKKASDAWKNAKDAVWNYRREAYLKNKPTVDLRALDEKIARHQKLLQVMRDNAAWAAKIRELEARSAKNDRAVEQAKPDGALARGEITER